MIGVLQTVETGQIDVLRRKCIMDIARRRIRSGTPSSISGKDRGGIEMCGGEQRVPSRKL